MREEEKENKLNAGKELEKKIPLNDQMARGDLIEKQETNPEL